MASNYQIRRMKPEDLQAVAKIEAGIFSQPWTEDGFRSSLCSSDTIYLVVTKEEKICGYCGLLQALDEADITNVAVCAEERGQGIARAMLSELMLEGEKKGIRAFTLEVRKSNEAALALYEKLGFVNVGIRKNFYDRPKEDAVIMWKYPDQETQ